MSARNPRPIPALSPVDIERFWIQGATPTQDTPESTSSFSSYGSIDTATQNRKSRGLLDPQVRARAKESREAAQKARLDAGLSATVSPGEKLQKNPTSMRAGVNAMCWQCQGGGVDDAGKWVDPDSGWRWSIGNCQITDCGLWNFRPYQNKHGTPEQGVYAGVPQHFLDGSEPTPEDHAEMQRLKDWQPDASFKASVALARKAARNP